LVMNIVNTPAFLSEDAEKLPALKSAALTPQPPPLAARP
jgi:hypothetical protein